MKLFSLIFFSIISITAFTQEISKDFTKILLKDNFTSHNDAWSQTFNIDNLFIRQNNSFDLIRKNTQTGYFVIPDFKDNLSSFEANVGFTLIEQSKKGSTAGILIMADKSKSAGILVEINQNRQYRISKLSPDKISPISNGKNGWSKSISTITKKYNEIKIKTHNKVYDLYINQRFITTFTDLELNRGTFGLYVGPASRASFDFLIISGEELTEIKDETKLPEDTSPEDLALTQIIVKLRGEISKKNKEIDELIVKLKNCNTSEVRPLPSQGRDTALVNRNKELIEQLKELKLENDIMRQELMKTKAEAMRLKKFKDEVESQQSGDIVITLTDLVSAQKERISDLEKKYNSLTDDKNSLQSEVKLLGNQINKRDEKINQLEKRNQELDSLANFYKDILIRFNIDPKNPIAPVQERKKDETKEEDKPAKEDDDDSIDNDYINRLIEREKEERKRREEEDN